MEERLAYLEMVHGTYEQRIDNERKHAGEQYKTLKEKYDQEVKSRKELEERVKSMEHRAPRRPRSQNRGRGRAQGALHFNGNFRATSNESPPELPNLDTTTQTFQRRKSFLPIPSRPSTPLMTPNRHSPPESSSSTLVSSSYSTFSRASFQTIDSSSSVASSTVRDTSPSPTTARLSGSQVITRPTLLSSRASPQSRNFKSTQGAKNSWADMVAKSGKS